MPDRNEIMIRKNCTPTYPLGGCNKYKKNVGGGHQLSTGLSNIVKGTPDPALSTLTLVHCFHSIINSKFYFGRFGLVDRIWFCWFGLIYPIGFIWKVWQCSQ